MAGCETCWNTAYRIARMTGRHQVDVYHELIRANPSDGSHHTDVVQSERGDSTLPSLDDDSPANVVDRLVGRDKTEGQQ